MTSQLPVAAAAYPMLKKLEGKKNKKKLDTKGPRVDMTVEAVAD